MVECWKDEAVTIRPMEYHCSIPSNDIDIDILTLSRDCVIKEGGFILLIMYVAAACNLTGCRQK